MISLTEQEIKKALDLCSYGKKDLCSQCPAKTIYQERCRQLLCEDALNLINAKDEEIRVFEVRLHLAYNKV